MYVQKWRHILPSLLEAPWYALRLESSFWQLNFLWFYHRSINSNICQLLILFCISSDLNEGKTDISSEGFLKKKTNKKPNSDFHWRLLGKSSHCRCWTVYFYLRALSLQVAAGGRHCNTGFMVSWWNPTESHKLLPVSKFTIHQSLLQAFGEIFWTHFIYQVY